MWLETDSSIINLDMVTRVSIGDLNGDWCVCAHFQDGNDRCLWVCETKAGAKRNLKKLISKIKSYNERVISFAEDE